MSFVGLFESPCNRVSWKRLSCEWYFFEHNQILTWLNLHFFPLELKSKQDCLCIFLAFFYCVKITQNVASLNFSAQNCRFTTVYKDVPSAPSVGPPAVAPSARNEVQKITQTRLKKQVWSAWLWYSLNEKNSKYIVEKTNQDIN